MRSTSSVEEPIKLLSGLTLTYISTCIFVCGYVGADATLSPSLYAGDGTSSSPASARESVHHFNVLSCSLFVAFSLFIRHTIHQTNFSLLINLLSL